MTTLRLEGLSKTYPRTKGPAVDRLTLDVDPGSIVALLGPSGCGKTTTLKMIAGLLEPTSGDILMDGLSVLDVPPERRNVVMVFQDHALFPFMSVGENIAFGLEMRKVKKSEIRRTVDEMLDLVQLSGMGDRRPAELSGGQQQRVALARAIVTRPKVLLLDEPLANLDAHLRDEMRSLILSVQKQTHITTIVVTHDQEEAVLLAERIALMFDGNMHHYDRPIELFQRPRSHRAARFFGGVNFIPASRHGVTAFTEVGAFRMDPCLAERMPDCPSLLTIRPEHVRVNAAEPQDRDPCHNSFHGTLLSCTFMGTHTRCRIRVGQTEIEAIAGVGTRIPPDGGRVMVTFPPEHLWLCPAPAVELPAAIANPGRIAALPLPESALPQGGKATVAIPAGRS